MILRHRQPPVLPAGPLLTAFGPQPMVTLTELGYHWHTPERDTVERALLRAQSTGRITAWAADRICCRVLRVHPALVYGDEWWDEISEEQARELEEAA